MKHHSFDALSFLLGATFTAIGCAFAFGGSDVDLRWVGPAVLIGIGLALIGGILQSAFRRPSQP